MKQKAAYLGPKGTFTQEAAQYLLPSSQYEFIPLRPFRDYINAVDNKSVDLGVVPVENTIEGSVTLTLDWLVHQVDIPITGRTRIPDLATLARTSVATGLPLNAFEKKTVTPPSGRPMSAVFTRKHAASEKMSMPTVRLKRLR